MEVQWWPEADERMDRLEHDGSARAVTAAIHRTLGRLETDPGDPRLGTRQFVSDELGHVRATPTRTGDWYVFWQLGEHDNTIEIILLAEVAI